MLKHSELVDRLERFSLKFVNVIPAPTDDQLQVLNLELKIGGIGTTDTGFRLRTEFNQGHYVRIVDIRTNATANLRSGAVTGLFLSIDCSSSRAVAALLAARLG